MLSSGRARALALLSGLIVAAFALHARSFSVPFILDDLVLPALLHPDGPLDPAAIPKMLWPAEEGFSYNHHFRPLGSLSAILDDLVFGLDPRGFRSVGIFLHALNAWLVGLLAARFAKGSAGVALASSLVFLLSPIGVEPVVWVCHRFTLLSTTGFLLAALATMKLAQAGGRGVLLFVLVLCGLLSKDSLLSQSFALVPFAFVVAPSKGRLRAALRTGVAVTIACLLDVLLRFLATGAWLPSYSGEGSVLETLDPAALASSLPGTLRILLCGWGDGSAPLALGACALGGGLLLLGITRRRALAPLTLLAFVLLASLPVLRVGDDHDGVRHLYLPLSVLAGVLGLSLREHAAWKVAGVAFLGLLLVPFLDLQGRYLEAGALIDQAVARVEEVAVEGEVVVVFDLPARHEGVPLFGEEGAHFPQRFKPPLREKALEVRSLRPELEVAKPLERARHLLFSPSAENPPPGFRLPGESEVAPSLLSIRSPAAGKPWPDPTRADGTALVFEAPEGERPVAWRVSIECGGRRAELILRDADQPWAAAPAAQPTLRVVPALALRPLFPSDALAGILAQAGAPAKPARIRIQALPKAGSRSAGASSPWHPFQLGRAP